MFIIRAAFRWLSRTPKILLHLKHPVLRKKKQAEEFGSDEGEFPQIRMDINLASPPRNLPLPQPVASSSRQQLPPALTSSISMRSLRSQRSAQASSVSSSAVGSAQSRISSSGKKRSKSMFFYISIE